jgi:DNA-binding transcriptional MocR family regulator
MTARYVELCENIIDNIVNQRLLMGQRMPSIRKFTQLHQVSMTTAINCYQRLQEQGWLQVKPQSGFFVSQPLDKKITPLFPTFKAQIRQPKMGNSLSSHLDGPLHSAQLSPELIPQEVLARCLRRGNLKHGDRVYQYPDYQGTTALRQALARHFSDQYFPLQAEALVITNGCIDAIRTAIEVTTKAGDAIAVSSPCFNGLLKLLENMGRMVVEIPCHQSELDLVQLEHHLATKSVTACLLSANHINPQGICLSNQQKRRIAELAQQYQIPVIEDDIYLELGYATVSPLPIKYWDKSGWVLWCSSVSKTIAPGYRLGWCEPGRFFKQYLYYRSVQSFGVNHPVQNAICEFIDSGQYLKHLKQLRLTLAQHALDYHVLLREHLPPQARLSAADGGMVIWIQIAGLDSQQLLTAARAQGIFFRGGNEFSTLDLYQDCFRLNIGWSIAGDCALSPEGQLRQQLISLCALISQLLSQH